MDFATVVFIRFLESVLISALASFHDHLGCLDIFLIISFLYAIFKVHIDARFASIFF